MPAPMAPRTLHDQKRFGSQILAGSFNPPWALPNLGLNQTGLGGDEEPVYRDSDVPACACVFEHLFGCEADAGAISGS